MCGTPLVGAVVGEGAVAYEDANAGERRQITVMFCDLVDSTVLGQRLDPEELQRVIRAYQDACAQVVRRYEGHLAQYAGDGLLVYFGYPHAHEDDAERALQAGLAIVDAIARVNTDLAATRVRLAVRIGVHSGVVVAGTTGGPEPEKQMFGHTMNLAARIQSGAPPDSVVASAATLRLVAGRFVTRDLGARDMKGIAEPVAIHQVIGPIETRDRLEAAATRLTPFVGREHELALMLDRWQQVREGHGQVVLLTGEAGIGKSRLVRVLRERIAGQSLLWLESHGSPYHEHSAFYPVVELLERALYLRREGSREEQAANFERALAAAGLRVEDVLPLFASLSLPLHGRQAADTATTDLQRRQTLDRLVAWLIATSTERPTAVIVEDLHWIDASTKELLDMLIEQVPTSPILLVITSRPSPNLAWTGRASVTHVTLSPLTRDQVGAMIDQLTGATLPATVRRAVTTKTDGVPLFVEEVTKAILEAGAERAEARSSIDVPATLQDSLMARLDRLGSPKDVAQLAAVLGREFSYELLHAVAPADPVFLDHSLRALVRAELVYQRGAPPHATYRFKHALVQEAAYRSLLKSRRQEAHARVVRVLEERFADRVVAEPEVIARHCAQAGLAAQAVRYYRLAGQRAAAASAHVEAVGHLTKALDLIRDVAQDPDRDREELAIRVALGPPLIAIRGYGDREVERTYERARTLCETIGEAPDLFEAVWGLANYYQSRGELGTARTLAEQLVTVSERSSEALLVAWAHLQLGATTFWRGEPAAAMPHFERAIAVHDPSAGLRLRGAPDPGVAARAYAAWALWQLGHADRALETCRESVALGRRCGDRFSLALALCFACAQHQLRREPDAVRAYAEEVVALSTAHGFPVWRGMGQLMLGWALAYSTDGAQAIDVIRDAMQQLVRVGTEVGAAGGLAVLADAERVLGHDAEALAAVETGLAVAAQHHDHVSDSELLRLKGELLVRTDPHAAEAAFRRAVATARAQRSTMVELRAATSLARFLVQAGRETEARAVLAGATERVHEGLDTPDVRDATELAREPAFAR